MIFMTCSTHDVPGVPRGFYADRAAPCQGRRMADDDATDTPTLEELAETVEGLRRRLFHLEERVKNIEER